MRARLLAVLLAAGLTGAGTSVWAQEPQEALRCTDPSVQPSGSVQGPLWDFHRVAELAGATETRARLINRPSSRPEVEICRELVPWELPASEREDGSFLIRATPASVVTFLNSGYPDDRNNGAVWEGRGFSASFSGGGRLRWGAVSLQIAPVIAYQENRDFEIYEIDVDAYSPFVYGRPGHTSGYIDLPQRFGDSSFWTVHPDQSYLRIDPGFLSAGISTENIWWGPGLRNSILMSNSGGGFPHAFLGTPGSVDIGIGTLEAEAVWGRLEESEHFDFVPENDERLFQALIATFSPAGADGLHLGAARVFYEVIPPGGLKASQYFRAFETPFKEDLATPENPAGDDTADQMLSLYGRWVFPAVGFEVFGEWALNDHAWDLEDFATEPDQSQGYTLGLQKLFGQQGRLVSLRAELTTLAPAATRLHRGPPNYYVHRWAPQGYTHRGQLLGAGIGPGADAQYVGLEVHRPWGRLGGFIERYRRNGHAYLRRARSIGVPPQQDVDLGLGLSGDYLSGRAMFEWSAAYYHRWHPYFGEGNDSNVKLRMGVVWVP